MLNSNVVRVILFLAAVTAAVYLWAALFPPGPPKPAEPKQQRPTATSGYAYCTSNGECEDSEDG